MPKPAMLTIAQVCQELQISQRTGHRRIRDGSIPARRFGKFWRISSDWVEAMRVDSGKLLHTPPAPEVPDAEKTPPPEWFSYKM